MPFWIDVSLIFHPNMAPKTHQHRAKFGAEMHPILGSFFGYIVCSMFAPIFEPLDLKKLVFFRRGTSFFEKASLRSQHRFLTPCWWQLGSILAQQIHPNPSNSNVASCCVAVLPTSRAAELPIGRTAKRFVRFVNGPMWTAIRSCIKYAFGLSGELC